MTRDELEVEMVAIMCRGYREGRDSYEIVKQILALIPETPPVWQGYSKCCKASVKRGNLSGLFCDACGKPCEIAEESKPKDIEKLGFYDQPSMACKINEIISVVNQLAKER